MLTFNRRRAGALFMLVTSTLAVGHVHAAPLLLVEGQNYAQLATPEPTASGKKIEVLEVFSYGCIHCFEFEPAMREWRKHLPKDVQLQLMPATFNINFAMYARGYYAAEALGVAMKLHDQVWDAIWVKKLEVPDINALANLYLRLGVDHDKFLVAAKSPEVEVALTNAGQKSERMKLGATPTLYVDGKYQVLLTGVTSYNDIIQRLDALILKVRAERRAPATSRQ
jgi:protein dithiol oxidoreductase (disulfide-forming)